MGSEKEQAHPMICPFGAADPSQVIRRRDLVNLSSSFIAAVEPVSNASEALRTTVSAVTEDAALSALLQSRQDRLQRYLFIQFMLVAFATAMLGAIAVLGFRIESRFESATARMEELSGWVHNVDTTASRAADAAEAFRYYAPVSPRADAAVPTVDGGCKP